MWRRSLLQRARIPTTIHLIAICLAIICFHAFATCNSHKVCVFGKIKWNGEYIKGIAQSNNWMSNYVTYFFTKITGTIMNKLCIPHRLLLPSYYWNEPLQSLPSGKMHSSVTIHGGNRYYGIFFRYYDNGTIDLKLWWYAYQKNKPTSAEIMNTSISIYLHNVDRASRAWTSSFKIW